MIQAEPESLEQIRARLRKLTDAQLIELERDCRELSDPKRNYGKPNPAFQVKREEGSCGMASKAPEVLKAT
jgi:hypothetical protein